MKRLGLINSGALSYNHRIYWETQLFARVRKWSDGITVFKFDINWDRYISDHTPAFQIELTILNIYNQIHIHQNNYEE
jgi:hypothetical protein